MILGTDRYVGKKATKQHPAVPAATAFAQDMLAIWGTAPFYLDASAVPTPAGGHHPLLDLGASARAANLILIPATHLAAPAEYQRAVQDLLRRDRNGVLLRVDLQQMTSAATWAPTWPVPLAETDLLVDFSDNVGMVAALGATLDHAFQNLHGRGLWRTVTMSGTSMPENFQGLTAGLYTIPRHEFRIWQRLAAVGLPYGLDYGDYATVPLVPPPSGIQWGYPINARYTLNGDFLICRGVQTTGPNAEDLDTQLVRHARAIGGYPSRGAIAHCWGDQRIDNIGPGREAPSGLEHWVKIAVNRHIELTRSLVP
jgi:hypothetical protein